MTVGLLAAATACGVAGTAATQAPASPPNPAATQASGSQATSTTVPGLTAPAASGVAGPSVRVAEAVFPVELAVSSEERIKGLSGRASLDAGSGMLFVFEEADRRRFWMKEMEFPLDIVWIGAECRVVDISENAPAPAPGTPLDDLPRYSPSSPAMYVLEINGGEAAALGLGAGDRVDFEGGLAGEYGC